MRTLQLLSFAAVATLVPTTANAAWSTRVLGGRSTQVYVPATQSPHGRRSLLVALHGCAQGTAPLQTAAGFADTAEALGMVVALPAKGGYPGCWEYFAAAPNRTTGDNAAVIGVAEALVADATADIDPEQVYLTGFSSGGGLAVVLGCLAPDVFAGVGIAAGPSLGGGVGLGTDAAAQCRELAGEFATDLDTQLLVAYASSDDGIVAPNQAELNAAMFEAVYAEGAAAMAEGSIDIAQFAGQMPTGEIAVWYDAIAPRVLHVTTAGAGHAWPGGTGTAGTYVYAGGIEFGRFLGEFFTDNNLRVDGNTPGGGPWGEPPGGVDSRGGADESGSSGGAGTSEGGDAPDDPTTAASSASDSDSSDDADSSDDGGGAIPTPTGDATSQVDPSGCQCTSAPAPAALGLLLLPFARRRRSARCLGDQPRPANAARSASSCARPN